MWFIIRVAFCVGVVFSMIPGVEATDAQGAASSMTGALVAPAMRELAAGTLSLCNSDPKLCLEMAQRLAGLEDGEAASTAPGAGGALGPGSDTLSAQDLAAPWHGASPQQRPRAAAPAISARVRRARPPSTRAAARAKRDLPPARHQQQRTADPA